jgi:hypothetical protein
LQLAVFDCFESAAFCDMAAAKKERKGTLKLSLSLREKAREARIGPTVCELEGPTPIENMSNTLLQKAPNYSQSNSEKNELEEK